MKNENRKQKQKEKKTVTVAFLFESLISQNFAHFTVTFGYKHNLFYWQQFHQYYCQKQSYIKFLLLTL